MLFFSALDSAQEKSSLDTLQGDSEGPIEVNVDQEITCEKNKKICTAEGNVVVIRKDRLLKGDKMVVRFCAESPSQKLSKLEVF